MKSRWYFKFPGEFYAHGPTDILFSNERHVRAYICECYHLATSRGIEVWRA